MVPRKHHHPVNSTSSSSSKSSKNNKLKTFVTLFVITIIVVLFFVSLLLYKNVSISEEELLLRRSFIRNMTRDAWYAYRKYAWGYDALDPTGDSHKAEQASQAVHSGLSIIAALSTLHVAGLMKEFNQGAHWLETRLTDFRHSLIDLQAHQLVNDYIGGLLSTYALSGDPVFKEKAAAIGNFLVPALNSSFTGLMLDDQMADLYYKSQYTLHKDPSVPLAHIGHRAPELFYLADLTKNNTLKVRLQRIEDFMKEIEKPKGVPFLEEIHVNSGKWTSRRRWSFSEKTIDFYFNLLRSYFQSAGRDYHSWKLFDNSIQTIVNNRLFKISKVNGLQYSGALNISSTYESTYENSMPAAACRLGAMFALAAKKNSKKYLPLAVNFTETCHRAVMKTETKLPPVEIKFSKREEATNLAITKSTLGFEMAESYFHLWRLTKEDIYREYAWQLALAIQTHCRSAETGGYGPVADVDVLPASVGHRQHEHFLSGTLKYLYLVYAEHENLLPQDSWVFSSTGHPLPICGEHPQYSLEACR